MTDPVVPTSFDCHAAGSVMSSFESMSPTLDPRHWSLHGGHAKDNCDAHDPTNGFWRDCTGAESGGNCLLVGRRVSQSGGRSVLREPIG